MYTAWVQTLLYIAVEGLLFDDIYKKKFKKRIRDSCCRSKSTKQDYEVK